MLKIKKIVPMFNRILVTCDKYEEDVIEGGIVRITAGTIKEYQKVISVGSTVRGIEEGDLVLINPTRYAVMKHEKGSLKDGVITDNPVIGYNLPVMELNGVPHLLIDTQDVDYVILDYEDDVVEETVEEKAAKAGIYTPGNTILT